MARRVAVIGDLHLAAPGTPLAFSGSRAGLLVWFDELLASHDLVVINGDLWDLERGRWPFSEARELDAARAAWSEIAAFEHHERVVVLAGNHDAILEREGRARVVEIEVGERRVRIEHGDAFDAPIKRVRRFATLMTWLSGRIAACGMAGMVEQMRRAEALLIGESGGDGPIERAGRALLKARADLDAVVLGHTHRPLLRSSAGGVLANPGPCDAATFRWTSIDGERDEIANFERSDGATSRVAHGDLARSARAVT